MDDVQYSQYYVAFLDILGFKKLVDNPDISCEDIVSVYEFTLYKYENFFKNSAKKIDNNIEMKIMSDSICLYIKTDVPNALLYLIAYCTTLQYDLLRGKKLLLRGGITSGDMYVKDDVIFGPALTEAYLLEERNAKVPRVIIRKKTIDEGISGIDKDMIDVLWRCLLRDDDAFYTLDYFQFLYIIRDNNEQDKQDKIEDLKAVKALIADYLDTTIDDSIRQKYLYVEKNINRYKLKEHYNA